MPLYFITGNKNKLAEVQSMIPEVQQLEIDLPEVQDIDPHKIIQAKLQEALKHHEGPLIVEDTSLEFDSLNGLPGPFIKWFIAALGPQGLAKLAARQDSTKARAKAIIGYASSSEGIQFFEGTVHGEIVMPRGETKFGWDPIFQPEDSGKTFAEMNKEEKNEISHRRKAVNKLKEYLNSK
jgi:inosine triphosphate pyrophosphatase